MKDWIIGTSKAIRKEELSYVEIEFDSSFWAWACDDTNSRRFLLCEEKTREELNNELNKILNN